MLAQTRRRVWQSSLSILLGLGLLSSCADASGTWTQMGSAIDGSTAQSQLGWYVALSYNGTRMAIGVPGVSKGNVRVYDFIDGAWELMNPVSGMTTTIQGTNSGDMFGQQLSMSADGTRLAISAPYHDGNGVDSGHVQVYEYSSGSWSQLGGDIMGQAANDKLQKVALSADGARVAVGTIWNNNKRGNTRVFEYSYVPATGTSDWVLMDYENRLAGEAANDFSAGHLALSSDGARIAISSYTAAGGAGHVRVFEYNGQQWTRMGTNINGESATAKLGEHSVAMSADGTRLIAGAFAYTSEGKSQRGRVRVYEFLNGDWQTLGSAIDGEKGGDWLGRYGASMSADGTRVAISSIKSDDGGTDKGRLRLYEYDETASDWVKMEPDINGLTAGEKFGNSAVLSGDGYTVAAAARQKTINGQSKAGQVRAFQFPKPLSPPPPPPPPLPPCTCCEKMALDAGFTTSRACALQ